MRNATEPASLSAPPVESLGRDLETRVARPFGAMDLVRTVSPGLRRAFLARPFGAGGLRRSARSPPSGRVGAPVGLLAPFGAGGAARFPQSHT